MKATKFNMASSEHISVAISSCHAQVQRSSLVLLAHS